MHDLQRMTKERLIDEWDRASWIVATLYNSNCKPGKQIKNPITINPMRTKGNGGNNAQVKALAEMLGATGLTRGKDRRPLKPELPIELRPDFVVGG